MKLKNSTIKQLNIYRQLLIHSQQKQLRIFKIKYSKIIFNLTYSLAKEGIINGYFYNQKTKNLFIFIKYLNNKNNLICLKGYKTLKTFNIIPYKNLLILQNSSPLCIFYINGSFYTQKDLIEKQLTGILIYLFI